MRKDQRTCKDCHAKYIRENRNRWPLSEEQKQKIRCRDYLRRMVLRGRVMRGVCAVCSVAEDIEGHHPDYTKPYVVTWLCRDHHAMVTQGFIEAPAPKLLEYLLIPFVPNKPHKYLIQSPNPKWEGIGLPTNIELHTIPREHDGTEVQQAAS